MGRLAAGLVFASASGGAVPATAQPGSISSYAGTYTGTSQLIVGSSEVEPGDAPACNAGGQVAFTVQDGRFIFPWQEPSAFHVRISPDGSFYATTGSPLALSGKRDMIVPIMQGRVDGAQLVAEYGTRWCRYRLQVTRS